MKANYLVCYDISDPVRLTRVLKYMKGRGVHLQYSVFFCSLTWPGLKQMKERLKDFINIEKDDIRIYPLPSGCKVKVLGLGARIPEGVDLLMDGCSSLKKVESAQLSPQPMDSKEEKGGGL